VQQPDYYLDFSCADIKANYIQIQNDLATTGDSVIIGIIDSGIDWYHEDFIDSNFQTRIKFLWDQTDIWGPPPAGYNYGKEYDSADIQWEINFGYHGNDFMGHGTHVAGIAAGNGRAKNGAYVGIAPKANLIIVKPIISHDEIMDAIEYIATKANQLDMPWVINMSMGFGYRFPKTHRGNHPLEVFIDSIVTSPYPSWGKGRVLVIAAGNDGDKGFHAMYSGPGELDLDIQTAYSAYDALGIYVIYPNADSDEAWIQMSAPDGTAYDSIALGCASNTSSMAGWVADTITPDGMLRICHNYFDQSYVSDPIQEGHPEDYVFLIELRDGYFNGQWQPLRSGIWKIRMGGAGLKDWDAYIYIFSPDIDDPDYRVKKFAAGSASSQHTIASPGYAEHVITVGSINSSRPGWTNFQGQWVPVLPGYPFDSISALSSLGNGRDGKIKPDVFAPGAFVMSCRSGNVTDSLSEAHDSNYVLHDLTGHYCIMAGTSMAAPHVAGTAALMLDMKPDLSADSIKKLIMKNGLKAGTDPLRMDIRVYAAVKAAKGIDGGVDPTPPAIVPDLFSLHQNYPNPFNPATSIMFEVFGSSERNPSPFVEVEVVNLLGQRLKTLIADNLSPGNHSLIWDGTDDEGNAVSSGVYFCRCICNGEVQSKKMALLK